MSARRFAALGFVLTTGCIATISEPHSEAHVAAMREATRHHHHGRHEEAANAWQRAADSADRRVDRDEADYRRARTYRRLGRVEDAISLLDDIARRRPISRRTVRARFDAAVMRLDRGQGSDRVEASEALQWIVREHPGQGPAGRALRLLLRDRSPTERLGLVRELLATVAESDLGDDLLTEEARLLREAGDLDGAVASLERLVAEHPYPRGQRWDDALFRLADIAMEREQPEVAIVYLRRMIEPHTGTVSPGSQTLPSFPRAGIRIARIYRDALDDPERADGAYRAMMEEFPSSRLRDDALYELGAMWLEQGQPARGCAALRELVEHFDVGHARRQAMRRLEQECSTR